MLTDEGFNATIKFCLILIIAQVADLLTNYFWDFNCWKWIVGFFLALYIINYEVLGGKIKDVEKMVGTAAGLKKPSSPK